MYILVDVFPLWRIPVKLNKHFPTFIINMWCLIRQSFQSFSNADHSLYLDVLNYFSPDALSCLMANCQYGCDILKGEVRCRCPSPGLQLGPDGRTCVGRWSNGDLICFFFLQNVFILTQNAVQESLSDVLRMHRTGSLKLLIMKTVIGLLLRCHCVRDCQCFPPVLQDSLSA